MHTKEKYGILGLVAFAAFAILAFVPGSFLAEALSEIVPLERPMEPTPQIPDTFSIMVNGSEEPTTVTVKRGESAQIDAVVTPLVKGIIGNVTIDSVKPECGTSALAIGCTPEGISVSLSEDGSNSSSQSVSDITSSKSLSVIVTIAPDMAPGIYGYQITADTMLDLPTQDQPVHTGYIYPFTIEVV